MTRYFLRHPLSGVAAAQVQDRLRRLRRGSRARRRSTTSACARASQDGRRGFRVTVAGGTSIMPVTGYVLYDFLPVEEMFERRRSGRARVPRVRRLRAQAAEPHEVRGQGARLGRASARSSRRSSTEFQRRGRRAAAVRSRSSRRVGERADWHAGGAARRCRRVAATAATPVQRPRHHARQREAAAAARRSVRALDAAPTSAAEAARLLPRRPSACRSATSPPGRCACWPIWPRRTATAPCG